MDKQQELTRCSVDKKCGGCRYRNISYEEQLSIKQHQEETLLSPFGRVRSIIGMERPYYYRNKVQAVFGYDYRRRRTLSGVFQSNSGRMVPVDKCLLDDETADAIILTVRRLCDSFKLAPFDKRNGSGFLRHILVRRGFMSGEVMVVLVSAVPAFPSKRNFVRALLQAHPQITTVVHNVNPYETELVLGEHSEVLYGKGVIEDTLCGMSFRISPASFYQVNPVQCETLYQTALLFAALTGEETVLDAYCGTGTIGLLAAKQAKQVIGVELNRDAVRDAMENAKRNGVKNIYFYGGDAGEYIETAVQEGTRFDVVLTDPPRAGASVPFLRAVCRMKPKRVVYISCNLQTLARDLRYLTQRGYKAKAIQPVDMFPYTKHVETACLLSRSDMNF